MKQIEAVTAAYLNECEANRLMPTAAGEEEFRKKAMKKIMRSLSGEGVLHAETLKKAGDRP
jgi:hypothetical protein